jgi:hypothetical protein
MYSIESCPGLGCFSSGFLEIIVSHRIFWMVFSDQGKVGKDF